MTPLEQKAAALPTRPGVYMFKDRRGKVLYVGKAVNIRARVRQYLAGQDERFMVPFLVRRAHDVDIVVVDSEKEALLLENTLIKEHRPRFNVKLRDDSNFLHLRIDSREPWPRYTLVRQLGGAGARFFGPYHSASSARQTLAFLHRAFPLRTCTDAVLKSRKRPCLLYQMGRCAAPCNGLIDRDTYGDLVEESMLLLEGRRKPLLRRLQERMHRSAEAEAFEEAARLRDLIASVERTLERQKVVDPRLQDRDLWGLYREGSRGVLTILPVREGMMFAPRATVLEGLVGGDAEVLSSLLNSAYPGGTTIPPEILLPQLPTDSDALAEVLSERRGRKVVLRAPTRGDKARLLALAGDNARVRYLQQDSEETRRERALAALAEVLDLPAPPHRMECFDNSHLRGAQPVAAMAVFLDGRPDRSEFRRYKVKTASGDDDYAAMREILERRMKRALKEESRPDLLVVDGGKGQLGVALAVLQDLGLHDQAVIGIAKPRTEHARGARHATDKIVLPHRKDPLQIRRDHPALRLLQHLRDEAHRHAVRYHRKRRSKETLTSVLEAIPGVGPARRKALLQHLGSARAVADADVDALVSVPGVGPVLAQTIYRTLHPE
ncbi:MAG: excinuclease ABC subunit UvrC [Deltaproteobacteria bacterium]|nr:excinuclease ABC subunit UvrC [Deltaproteobacteria bacterium]